MIERRTHTVNVLGRQRPPIWVLLGRCGRSTEGFGDLIADRAAKLTRSFPVRYLPGHGVQKLVDQPEHPTWIVLIWLILQDEISFHGLRSILRALFLTKHVRNTDSDYVMKEPSRCLLGAVPRYWKVVASCFQIVSFAENTSAPLASRARTFQPIRLLFFFVFLLLNLSTKRCLRFFYSVSKFNGVQKKTEFA